MTTNIDTVLRNLDVQNLVLAGVLTDQCVESAVRDACDLNYLVTLITGGLACMGLARCETNSRVPDCSFLAFGPWQHQQLQPEAAA